MSSPSPVVTRLARPRISLVPVSVVALLGAASCGTEATTSNDELQALLDDEPLTQIAVSALRPPDGGVGPGSGGSTGFDGGMAGSGGSGPVLDGGAGVGGSVAGRGGTTGTAGRGGSGGPVMGRLGEWTFDDCNTTRTNLRDSTFMGNTAFRAVSVACAAGIAGQAVALADKNEDLVYVPDQPNFTFASGVTVAGWFNHTALDETRTLFRKRDGNTSAFALVLKNQKYEFVVNLGATAASVISPKIAKVNEWTHVAATYDGNTLRLYINGILVVAKGVVGAIMPVAPAPGPFLMGNDGSKRLMAGRIDQALLDMRALTDAEIRVLTCLRRPPTVTGTPAVSAPTPTDVPASFDIAITNNDLPSCVASDFFFQVNTFIPNISIQPTFQFVNQVPAGGTAHLTMTATASDDVDSGTFPIPFSVFSPFAGGQPAQGRVDFVVVASGCRVSTAKELMITNIGVVDDARTQGDGVWSFKHLMEAMAPSAGEAADMVEQMLTSFLSTQTVNGFNIEPRLGMQSRILDNWPRTEDGKLDLSQPLLRLQAIVNRFDLRNLAAGDAGEGRFVFAFEAPFYNYGTFPLQATLILEYKLPASSPDDVLGWANAWHGLGALTQGTAAYNAALEAITERFAGRNARPGPSFPNGSAINAVRTNEIDLGQNGIWELREFVLSPSTGMLVPATVKLTPDLGFNFTNTLASFINGNEMAIIAETHTVPEQFEGAPFLAGAVFNDFFTTWRAPGINNNEARHKFALNTCNGCHSIETGVNFLQIGPRFPGDGSEASLSGFLTGTVVPDPVTGEPRQFNDLARRRADLRMQVCPADPAPMPMPGPIMGGTGGTGGRATPSPSQLRLGTLTRGISRTH
jgi:hypothetical protein